MTNELAKTVAVSESEFISKKEKIEVLEEIVLQLLREMRLELAINTHQGMVADTPTYIFAAPSLKEVNFNKKRQDIISRINDLERRLKDIGVNYDK